MIQPVRLIAIPIIFLLVGHLLPGCAKDRYQQRADLIKDHTSAFFEHVQAGRVADAVLENERIEALGHQSETALLRHADRYDNNQKVREWVLVKMAYEAAAENWLSLARYFIQKKQYQKARGTYQRVIESYQDEPYQSYVYRAKTGLRDLDLILNPT
jgi:tetratricopeptide (TPR) repeat protein